MKRRFLLFHPDTKSRHLFIWGNGQMRVWSRCTYGPDASSVSPVDRKLGIANGSRQIA